MNSPKKYLFFSKEKDRRKAEKTAKKIVARILEKAGMSEEFIYAFHKTGLLVTTENWHCLLKEDKNKWRAAIRKYRRSHRLHKESKK